MELQSTANAASLNPAFAPGNVGQSSIIAQLFGQNNSGFGLDIAGLKADISAITALDQEFGKQLGALVQGSLSPVQAGDFLSGRTGEVNTGAVLAQSDDAKPKARPATTASDVAGVASPGTAPSQIRLSPAVETVLDTQWKKSFPGGKSQEQGGTIVADAKGNLSVQNIGGNGSTSGTFSIDTTIKDPSNFTLVGSFHTHPYDKSESSYTGVSFSGADIGNLINATDQNIKIVRSGDREFALVRTKDTPTSVDASALNKSQNERIAALVGKGYPLPQASRIAAAETAKTYGLAYYQGSNGTLERIK